MKPTKTLLWSCVAAFALLGLPILWANSTGLHCAVHRAPLRRGWVKVTYGLAQPIPAPRWQFPNANTHLLGGCVISPFSPPYGSVQFCPQCRIEEEKWFAAHPTGAPFSQRQQLFTRNRQWFKTHSTTY